MMLFHIVIRRPRHLAKNSVKFKKEGYGIMEKQNVLTWLAFWGVFCAVAWMAAVSLQGCRASDRKVALFAVETAGMTAGNLIAKNNPEIIPAVKEYYQAYLDGRLTVKALNDGIERLSEDREVDPLIIDRLLALAEMVGAEVVDYEILGISNLDPEFLNAAVTGFAKGVALAENRRAGSANDHEMP